jgi:hypothetical protein
MGPRVEHLRLVPLFRGFSDDELTEIAALFEPAQVRPDRSLFDTGEPAT